MIAFEVFLIKEQMMKGFGIEGATERIGGKADSPIAAKFW